MTKIKAGLIGAGNISGAYLNNRSRFPFLDIVACADLDIDRAKARAEEFGVKGCSVDELLADPEIELVINLTIPQAHAAVYQKALEAGKHVYGEKPLTVTLEEGQSVLAKARENGLLVGSAPDTFLGGGLQTCIKAVSDGLIGTPIAATAFMMSGGHESWHPDPAFYYKKGGGPMYDMGPYYLTALVSLLGPVAKVTGSTRITHAQRTIGSQPKKGEVIDVEVPTHVVGVLEFEEGPIATIVTSFDIKAGSTLPCIELYGTAGTMIIPDPNNFGGVVRYRKAGEQEFVDLPLSHGNTDNARGIGAADLARAIVQKDDPRASGDMAYHVLEIMHGIHEAADQGKHYVMQSSCKQPQPLGHALD